MLCSPLSKVYSAAIDWTSPIRQTVVFVCLSLVVFPNWAIASSGVHGPVNWNTVVERKYNTCTRTGGHVSAVGGGKVGGTDDVSTMYFIGIGAEGECRACCPSPPFGRSRKNTRRVLTHRPGRSRPCHAAKLFVIPRVDSSLSAGGPG